MFLSKALFVFIYSQHACANVRFVKIHRHPPCPPPQKKTGGASSPFSGGKKRGAGFRTQKAGAGSDGKARCCEDAGENSLLKESFPPGSEAYAVEATHNAGSRASRAVSACFTPSQIIAQTVCIPLMI